MHFNYETGFTFFNLDQKKIMHIYVLRGVFYSENSKNVQKHPLCVRNKFWIHTKKLITCSLASNLSFRQT